MLGTPLERAKTAAQLLLKHGPQRPGSIVALPVRYASERTTPPTAAFLLPSSTRWRLRSDGALSGRLRCHQLPPLRRRRARGHSVSDGAEYAATAPMGVKPLPVKRSCAACGQHHWPRSAPTAASFSSYPAAPTPGIRIAHARRADADLHRPRRAVAQQYVITLDVPLALDGTQYNLALQVLTPQGSADATAVLRAPIPVPIVRCPNWPSRERADRRGRDGAGRRPDMA